MTAGFAAVPGSLGAGGLLGLGTPLGRATCSRAGCREAATMQLDWRNPRIHAADRVKTWLACPEHADYLSEFLRLRDFPLSVRPLDVGPADTDPANAEPAHAEPADAEPADAEPADADLTDADRGRLRE